MPVESLIRDARQDYYAALNACNQFFQPSRLSESETGSAGATR
ncbi:hypothetical protein [Thiorhodovibrio winogradskyi]|nr:hypothetical protein [Thiorhodovibrio winogradskyi]